MGQQSPSKPEFNLSTRLLFCIAKWPWRQAATHGESTRLFIDEAEAHIAPQRYRYAEADRDTKWQWQWQLYAIPGMVIEVAEPVGKNRPPPWARTPSPLQNPAGNRRGFLLRKPLQTAQEPPLTKTPNPKLEQPAPFQAPPNKSNHETSRQNLTKAMSKKTALAAAETLATELKAHGLEASAADVPKNEWLAKILLPEGNLCVYANAKGKISVKTNELDPAAREPMEKLLDALQAKALTPTAAIQSQKTGVTTPLVAYTDGSDQGGQCGWAAVIVGATPREITGNLGQQPNKQIAGEVEGAIQAICHAIQCKAPTIEIRHDYQGVGHWARREWKANDPDARRLQNWCDHARENGVEIQFTWTRGHNGDPGNERADKLAGQATLVTATPRIESPKTRLEKAVEKASARLSGMEM